MIYEKPILVIQDELAEGVYMASGSRYTECSSKYMKGTYQPPEGGRISTGTKTTGRQLGCQTCPGDRNWACHAMEGSTQILMPQWEKDGHSPDDIFLYNE